MQDGREADPPGLFAEHPAVDVHVVAALGGHLAHDRLGHHVPRRELGELVLADHEPLAGGVQQVAALAADRFADQRQLAAGTGAEVEHGRVELDELDVPQSGARPERGGHAVSGGHRRIGGRGVDLADPAGRQDHRAGVHGAHPFSAALAEHVQGDPGDRGRLPGRDLGRDQVEDQRLLDDLDAPVRPDRGDQRPLDLRAGGIPAGVRDPITVVPALPGQLELAGGVAIELGPAGDQLGDLVGTLRDQYAYGLLDAQPGAGHQGVGDVLLDRVPLRLDRGDATLRPVRRAGCDHVLGDDHHRAELAALQRGCQSRDPRTDHDHVDPVHPAGRLGGQPAGEIGQHGQIGQQRAGTVVIVEDHDVMLSHAGADPVAGSDGERPRTLPETVELRHPPPACRCRRSTVAGKGRPGCGEGQASRRSSS